MFANQVTFRLIASGLAVFCAACTSDDSGVVLDASIPEKNLSGTVQGAPFESMGATGWFEGTTLFVRTLNEADACGQYVPRESLLVVTVTLPPDAQAQDSYALGLGLDDPLVTGTSFSESGEPTHVVLSDGTLEVFALTAETIEVGMLAENSAMALEGRIIAPLCVGP